MHSKQRNTTTMGALFGIGAFVLWGIFPFYFKALDHVSALELLAHRIVWSVLFLLVLSVYLPLWKKTFSALVNKKVFATLFVTAILIGFNWLLYIWAVNNDHMIDASLGYFLCPLLSVFLGVVILKEKLKRLQLIAVVIAFVAVAYLAFASATFPWVAVALASTFSLYGLFRKLVPCNALVGLLVESILLVPLAAFYLAHLHFEKQMAFLTVDLSTTILLLCAGAVTAVPLILFVEASKRMHYSTLGFISYIGPSLQFLIGVFAFKEPLDSNKLLAFCLVWFALLIFSLSRVFPEKNKALP